nr:hypothetical protein [Ralstonia sp. LMG 6871]
MSEHRQDESCNGKRQRPPEAALEVFQLGVLFVTQFRNHRFQRHTADRTIAWAVLPDFRMHGAGVDGPRSGAGGRGRNAVCVDLPDGRCCSSIVPVHHIVPFMMMAGMPVMRTCVIVLGSVDVAVLFH